eukprot:TRINITY_DN27377_c0_g1_i1.p1 TRINITY_DN27377_c0_g1~~TRINITY_DN27377_c0_g1_i1.p1  ORF type:complete len:342 (+),score=79.91 TRINITY_DN27377_c0_g1_i1:59-1084(+)
MPRRIVCIGDLHGNLPECLELWGNLEALHGAEALQHEITVVFLGDYCDRGPNTKGVLDWLIALKASRPEGSTRFVAGNHDFAMAAFLGLVEGGAEELDGTRKEEFTTGFWRHRVPEGMHYQGRRWGGHSVYESKPTFTSYGLTGQDFHSGSVESREKLLEAVPDAHKVFLRELEWMVELELDGDDEDVAAQRVICIHAGLDGAVDPVFMRKPYVEHLISRNVDGVQTNADAVAWLDRYVGAQLAALRRKDWRVPELFDRQDPGRIAAFSGRGSVEETPPVPCLRNTILVSGHHGFRALDKASRRVILDRNGGRPGRAIEAIELPSWGVTSSDQVLVEGVRA